MQKLFIIRLLHFNKAWLLVYCIYLAVLAWQLQSATNEVQTGKYKPEHGDLSVSLMELE